MQQARNTNHCNNHPILDSSVFAYLNLNGDFFFYISKMSVFVNNVPLKCLNLTLWLALEHYSFSLFILQDCESAEAESGIAQTTVGMYIFLSEGAGVGHGDQPTDVGLEVLRCHSWVFDAFWTDLCA